LRKIERIVEETGKLEKLGFIKISGLPFFRECEKLFKHPEHDDKRLAWALRISAKMYLPAYLVLKGEISLDSAREWIIRNVHKIQDYQKERVRRFLPASNIRQIESRNEVEHELLDLIRDN